MFTITGLSQILSPVRWCPRLTSVEDAVTPVLTPVTVAERPSQSPVGGEGECRLRFRPVPLPRHAVPSLPPDPESAGLPGVAVGGADDSFGAPSVLLDPEVVSTPEMAVSATGGATDESVTAAASAGQNSDGLFQPETPVGLRRSSRDRRQSDWYGRSNP